MSDPLTNQEAFSQMIRHLRKQGKPARLNYLPHQGNNCMFRNFKGLKCAVGCLIPDLSYHEDLEGQSVHYLIKHISILSNLSSRLLGKMQEVHDIKDPRIWEACYKNVAAEFSLEIPE